MRFYRDRVAGIRSVILGVTLGVMGQLASQGAKVLFVVNSVVDAVTTANPNDQEVVDRMVSQGHAVTIVDDDLVSAAEALANDLVIISSSSSSTAAGVNPLCRNVLRTGRIPFICYEPALYDELLMQTADTYGNTAGQTSLGMVSANQAHPLAAGKSGNVEVVVPGETAVFSSSALPVTIGGEPILVATNTTPDHVDLGRVAIWAYDVGAKIADNVTIAGSRRVAFFYNATTAVGVYNSTATDLFDGAVRWALQPPASTPVGVVSQSPAPNQTSVPVDATIVAEIEDGSATAVNQGSIKLTVNGAVVSPAISKTGTRTKVSFKPGVPFGSGQGVVVELTFNDTSNPPKSFTSSWRFTTVRVATAPAAFRQSETGLVVVEAENFHANTAVEAHRWEFATTPAGFGGDGTMYALPETGTTRGLPDALTLSPRLDYKIQFVKTGTHYFWFRGSDGGGDSLHAGIDDVDPTGSTLDNLDENCCGDRATGGLTLTWVPGVDATPEGRAVFEVTTLGEHTIHLWMREDGQIVDRFLITTDPSYSPANIGPDESRRVGEPIKPVVSLTSPAEGAQIAANSDVVISATATDADGTVAKVEFFEGTNKIGEDTSSPFSLAWRPSVQRSYTLSARATDNGGDTAISPGVKIIYGNPPAVAFFGNNPLSNAGDLLAIGRLEARGFQVAAIDDNASLSSDADGKVLIVISSSVSSGQIADKFTASAVPIINWEEALMDDLLLTGDSGAEPDHHGTTGGQTAIEIVNANHPLAAGLSAGSQPVFSAGSTMVWGYPEANAQNAIIVGRVPGTTNQISLFAYEKGATLFDGATKAPARRVAFFFHDSSQSITETGFRLFEAAVSWALNLVVDDPPSRLTVSQSAGSVTIGWSGTGRLQQADAISGPWTDSASQQNPQTIGVTAGARFFRVAR